MYFQPQVLDYTKKGVLVEHIIRKGFGIDQKRQPYYDGNISLYNKEGIWLNNLFDNEDEGLEVSHYIQSIDTEDDAGRLSILAALVSYLRPSFFFQTGYPNTPFKIAREGIIRSCLMIAFGYFCGVDMKLFKTNDLYKSYEDALAWLNKSCKDGLGLNSMNKAIRLVTDAEYGSELETEGWYRYGDAYSRGYIKVADSGKVSELHMRGQLLGVLSTYDHYSGSTWYFKKHHYKFNPIEDTANLLLWFDKGYSGIPDWQACEQSAHRIVRQYVTP